MKPGNIIKLIRESKGIKSQELAKKIGCSSATMTMLENGKRRLSHEWMIKIATALNCRPEDLIRNNLSIKVGENGKIELMKGLAYSTDNNGNVYDEDNNLIITIPMYASIASAGNGEIVFTDDIECKIILEVFNEITGMSLKESDVTKNRFSFLRAKGDSMSPYIEDKNLLLLDHYSTNIEYHKKIVVFIDSFNNIFVKEIYKTPGEKINIISYNPEYESYIKMTKEQIESEYEGEIRVIGEVIWHGSPTGYLKKGNIKV